MSTNVEIENIEKYLEVLEKYLNNEDKCIPIEEALPEDLHARLKETRDKVLADYGDSEAYYAFIDAFSWLRDTLYARGDMQFLDEMGFRELQKAAFCPAQRRIFYRKLKESA